MKTVTEKNTKSHILAAYKELVSEYNELAKKKVSVKDKIKKCEKDDLCIKVKEMPKKNLFGALQTFLKEAEKIDNQMLEAETNFTAISKAVEHKEQELKDLFGVENECHSLIALKEAQKSELEKFKLKQSEDEKAHNLKKEEYQDALKDLEDSYVKKEKELAYALQRKKIELTYDLDLERKKQNAVITDEKKVLEDAKKEFQDEKEAFNTIKEEFDEKIKTIMEENEKKITEVKDTLEKDFENEKSVMEAKYEAMLDKKDFAITTLQGNVKNLENSNYDLSKKLEESYKRLQELAQETVRSRSKDEMIERLSSLAKKNNSNN